MLWVWMLENVSRDEADMFEVGPRRRGSLRSSLRDACVYGID